ncbi:MAG: hypothetical protein ACYSWW_07110 [Planctomycetota bacterium]|jgi:hypothetical protein
MVTVKALARNKKTSNIRLFVFAVMIVSLGGSTVLALDPLGPPAAGLKRGQFRMGVDFSHGEMDLELRNGAWVESLDGVFFDAGDATTFTLKDFEINRDYANFGYGLIDQLEVFMRFGGTNGDFGDSLWEDGEEFESNSDLAVGGGIKATFIKVGGFKLGGLFQASWAAFDGQLYAPHWAAADHVEIDLTEVQIAVGPSYTWADRISIYGGPFFHFVSGDLYDTFSEVDVGGGLLTSEYLWQIDEDSVFGAYFGLQLYLIAGCSFNVEYQRTAAADALGASLMWRF